MIIRKTLTVLILCAILLSFIFSSSLSVKGMIKECTDTDSVCSVDFISLHAVSTSDTCYMTINSEMPDTGDCREMKIIGYILKSCTLSSMNYTDTSVIYEGDTLNFDSTGLKSIMLLCDSIMYEFIVTDFHLNYSDSSCASE